MRSFGNKMLDSRGIFCFNVCALPFLFKTFAPEFFRLPSFVLILLSRSRRGFLLRSLFAGSVAISRHDEREDVCTRTMQVEGNGSKYHGKNKIVTRNARQEDSGTKV